MSALIPAAILGGNTLARLVALRNNDAAYSMMVTRPLGGFLRM